MQLEALRPRRHTPYVAATQTAVRERVRAQARTGVEMEALVAASAAGLALYDMCKAIDRDMTLDAVRLVRKRGGKSGEWSSTSFVPVGHGVVS